MRPEIKISHQFVEYIPETLEQYTLYISETYGTAVHKCFCGCGREVVTPLSPIGWQFTRDGDTISLSPSIGSWSLPCQSHYFITHSRVIWAGQWSQEQIAFGRKREEEIRESYFNNQSESIAPLKDTPPLRPSPRRTLWQWFKNLFFRT